MMKVEWTNKAEQDRDNIADYICDSFGARRRDQFLQEVRQTTKMLKRHPNIGPIDPLFADRPASYRSVIVGGLSKMVYIVEGEGKVLFDDTEEAVKPGMVHYCPEGHSHSLINNGSEDLVFYAVVPKQ